MDGQEELDRRGRDLLAEVAADPGGECSRQFDALFYPLVWRYLCANHASLNVRVARFLGVDAAVAPVVLPEEVAEVAHDATVIALRRVRANADRFDPDRGTPTKWVIGAAHYAWIEVAKAIAAARRPKGLYFVDPQKLIGTPSHEATPEDHVVRQVEDARALADAATHLTESEFLALRLVATAGYTYREAAIEIFGDEKMTKQIDGLLSRGKRKLAQAWGERRPARSSGAGSKLRVRPGDKEGSDG